MKNVRFTLCIAVTALFLSCSKNDISNENMVKALADTEPNAASVSVITGWEGGYSWQQSDSSDYRIFSFDRSLPGLNQDIIRNGAVLVFVKNIILEDDRRVNKPIRIPFHVLPSLGKPGYDQVWYHVNSPGHVKLKYRTNKHKYGIAAEVPDQYVEARYFIISPNDLTRYKLTPASVSRLNYQQLISLLGAAE